MQLIIKSVLSVEKFHIRMLYSLTFLFCACLSVDCWFLHFSSSNLYQFVWTNSENETRKRINKYVTTPTLLLLYFYFYIIIIFFWNGCWSNAPDFFNAHLNLLYMHTNFKCTTHLSEIIFENFLKRTNRWNDQINTFFNTQSIGFCKRSIKMSIFLSLPLVHSFAWLPWSWSRVTSQFSFFFLSLLACRRNNACYRCCHS